jgi:hypothetical protein
MKRALIFFVAIILFSFSFTGCPRCRDNPEDSEPPVMITPYQNISEMSVINEAYSESSSCPWGFIHQGIDFFPVSDLATFRAVSNGTIERIDRFYNTGNGYWQVNLDLRINSVYRVGYAFEPMSSNSADADTQMSNILVTQGQTVTQGQALGRLLVRGGGTHVHFGLYKGNNPICPESYFTEDARNSILLILHRTYPGANICY